ncbi:hypothetical protein RJ639_041624 [Escallonia herrerae]|uniref:Uncharacterized protein n=1 Tax=Escallonia herrerae TaxID=1293975 RepID=A0AA88WH07_9ASTE|nr:hypothetical protein RJ639_041624 [Escallonia herrerae]
MDTHRFPQSPHPPTHYQLLLPNGRHLYDDASPLVKRAPPTYSPPPRPPPRWLRRVGSLLHGAATKAGQKKTNNFDACRDMSGRRARERCLEYFIVFLVLGMERLKSELQARGLKCGGTLQERG